MRTPAPAFSQPRATRLSPLAGALALALTPSAHALFVTTNADSGPGSLRQAILDANAACFTTPSPTIFIEGAFTIAPSDPLPAFNCLGANYNPTIDATTYGGTLQGPAGGASCGLNYIYNFTYGGALTVKGMTIKNFQYGGSAAGVCGVVTLLGNTIINNNIGVRTGGVSNTTVGGPGSSDRNIIAGNTGAGILGYGGAVTIENNLIGTQNGMTASPNGVGIDVSTADTFITGNVVSGNSGVGIWLRNVDFGSQIDGALVGVTEDASAKLANGGGGIRIEDSFVIMVSNSTISGNSVAGIEVRDSDSIFVYDNYIGTNASGASLGNSVGVVGFCSGYIDIQDSTIARNLGHGVEFATVEDGSLFFNTISNNGGSGVRLSGGLDCIYNGNDGRLQDNTITNNGQNGVEVLGGFGSPVGNTVMGGTITGNKIKNISLSAGSTPLPNDPGDTDGGANRQQNYPDEISVVQSGGLTTVNFSLDSSGTYTVRAYANPAPGKPGGEFVGSVSVCGLCSSSITLEGLYDNISLTATNDLTGDTSEFSPMAFAETAPAVALLPATVDFGRVEVDSESRDKIVVLRSLGDQPWVISDILSGGDGCSYGGPICSGGAFACSTTCETDTPYGKNQSCSVTAKFTPFFQGLQSTTITFCDNTSTSPNTITLLGEGVPPPPLVLTPNTWDFGGVPVGGTSNPRRFTLSNTNDYGGDILIDIQTTGEFDVDGTTCGSAIAPRNSCDINVTFGPTTPGDSFGELRVEYMEDIAAAAAAFSAGIRPTAAAVKAATSTVKSSLRGVGLGGGSLGLPESVSVGAAVFGGAPISALVTITNNGTSPAAIASITVSSPFTLVNNCPAVLEAGQSCTLNVGFAAPGVGPFTGTLTVVSDSGSAEIPVTATGQVALTPLLRVEPTTMGFGSRVIGSLSTSQSVVITNIGGAAATLSLASTSIDFLLTVGGCSGTLLPNTACTAQVGFRPLGFGPRPGSISVGSNAPNSPQVVELNGTGCRPFLTTGRGNDFANCAP